MLVGFVISSNNTSLKTVSMNTGDFSNIEAFRGKWREVILHIGAGNYVAPLRAQ